MTEPTTDRSVDYMLAVLFPTKPEKLVWKIHSPLLDWARKGLPEDEEPTGVKNMVANLACWMQDMVTAHCRYRVDHGRGKAGMKS